jgi:hypothetical protein
VASSLAAGPAVPALGCFARPSEPISVSGAFSSFASSYFDRLHLLVRDLLLQPLAFRFCLLQQNLPAFLSPA